MHQLINRGCKGVGTYSKALIQYFQFLADNQLTWDEMSPRNRGPAEESPNLPNLSLLYIHKFKGVVIFTIYHIVTYLCSYFTCYDLEYLTAFAIKLSHNYFSHNSLFFKEI